MFAPSPLLVKVSRLEASPQVKGKLITKEMVEGYMVDSQGQFVESPAIGQPIILSKTSDVINLDFETPPVNYIEIHEAKWLVQTDIGVFSVFHGRRLH
jgi:hypothetical protein